MGVAQPRSLLKRGLFGGRFDPIHAGHTHLMDWCLSRGLVDCIEVIPTAHPVHKPITIPYATRRQLIADAIQPLGPMVTINDVEALRDGPSWMIDTVDAIHAQHPHDTLCLLMGSDTLVDFPRWHHADRLQSLVRLIVFNRPTHPIEPLHAWASQTLSCPIEWVSDSNWDISSSAQRRPTRWVIGLTGRMGTGKTTAAHYLKTHYGIPVIGLDELGHGCLADPTVQSELSQSLGPLRYTPQGEVDRQWLGQLVFGSPDALAHLNRTVHPLLRHACLDALSHYPQGVVLIEGALIHAIGLAPVCHEIWVMDATDATIRKRIGARADRLWAQSPRSAYQEWGRLIQAASLVALEAQLSDWIGPLLQQWPLTH